MEDKTKIIGLINSIIRLRDAEDIRLLRGTEREWVEDTPKIHVLNYWWYRYFTNELLIYVLKKYKN